MGSGHADTDRRDALFRQARILVASDLAPAREAAAKVYEVFSTEDPPFAPEFPVSPAFRAVNTKHTEREATLVYPRLARMASALCIADPDTSSDWRAGWLKFNSNEPMQSRRSAAWRFIVAVLTTADPNFTGTGLPQLRELGGHPWDIEPDKTGELGRRMIIWRDDDGDLPDDPPRQVLDRLERAMHLIRRSTADAVPPMHGTGDMATSAGATSDLGGGPVFKPDGWTRAELIAQANHDDRGDRKTLGTSTFDRIRKEAGIPSAEKGGVGAQRRFSLADLRKLIDAAEAGTYRKGSEIAAAWRELLPS